jgi:hypothetical protein
MPLLSAGVRLGSYEIVELVGRGGMGEVYKAFDVVLRRHAAVKVLPDSGAGDDADERVQRFLREARAASALNHPNIVTIYDAGSTAIAQDEPTHYIAMELIDGSTLRAKLGAPIEDLLPIFVQVADALAKAHEAGVVHRDLKPENILVRTDGVAKIVDFGLAKSFAGLAGGESQFETHEGVLVGTLAYMSPEQVKGRPVDGRSDMFAFGSMLFEAVTGTLPFVADSALETLQRIANDAPRWLGHGTGALQQVIERCVAKHPDDRYPTMADVAAALRATQTEATPAAPTSRAGPAAELSTAAREVVNVAAVIGMTVSVRELRDLLDGPDALDDSLDELVGHGILVERDARRGTFRFASAAECEAFYSRIPRRRRKEIHSACAAHGERLLGARLATTELLRHFQSAGAAAKVVGYGLPLLRDLVERFRPKDAIEVADLISEAAGDDLAPVLEATELLARAYAQLGDFDRALERIDAIRPVLEASPEALTRLARTAAQVAWEARRVDVAERWIRRGLSGSDRSGDAAPVRDLLALATTIAMVTGDTATADEYALRLLREVERPAARSDLRGGRIVVPSMRSLAEIDPSKSDQAWRGVIIGSIFETLTRVAANGRIVPWLAEFEANADSTAFRFCLREGLRFHNGRAVTSEMWRSAMRGSSGSTPMRRAGWWGPPGVLAPSQTDRPRDWRGSSVTRIASSPSSSPARWPCSLRLRALQGQESFRRRPARCRGRGKRRASEPVPIGWRVSSRTGGWSWRPIRITGAKGFRAPAASRSSWASLLPRSSSDFVRAS